LQVLDPHLPRRSDQRAAIEIGERAHRALVVDEQRLVVVLRYGPDDQHGERLLEGGDDDRIAAIHAEVGVAARHFQRDTRARSAGEQRDVQPSFRKISLGQRLVQTPVLRLRVPIGLKYDLARMRRRKRRLLAGAGDPSDQEENYRCGRKKPEIHAHPSAKR